MMHMMAQSLRPYFGIFGSQECAPRKQGRHKVAVFKDKVPLELCLIGNPDFICLNSPGAQFQGRNRATKTRKVSSLLFTNNVCGFVCL